MAKKPPLVRKFIKKLNLQWEVIIVPIRGETATIKSGFIDLSKKIGYHRLFVPPTYLTRPKYFQVDWAHNLTHALLAEKIDLIFAGSPVVGGTDSRETDRRVQILFFATRQEDLFVNDAREELLGHDLTVDDICSTHQHILRLIKMADSGQPEVNQFLEDKLLLWIIALNIAEDQRYKCGIGVEEVLEFFEPNSQQIIKKICSIYQDLPSLSWDPKRDLRALEENVQRIIVEIFNEDWKPEMINHPWFPGQKVWSVQ